MFGVQLPGLIIVSLAKRKTMEMNWKGIKGSKSGDVAGFKLSSYLR